MRSLANGADSASQPLLESPGASSVNQWPGIPPLISPQTDAINRWHWPDLQGPAYDLLARSGRLRRLAESWIEDLICGLVPLSPERETELLETWYQAHPDQSSTSSGLELPELVATRQERLNLFKQANFTLLVEERFTRTKRQRDRIIYSMLRCRDLGRIQELALAIREGDIDFAAAAIRYSEGPESAQGGRIGPIAPTVGHPELNQRLDQANEGDLIGPFPIGDTHVLLRLDTRITTRLDEALQQQLIEELFQEWLNRQVDALLSGESIEPMEYLPSP